MKRENLITTCKKALELKIERDKHQARYFALSDAIKDIRSGSEYFNASSDKQERIFSLYEQIIELNHKLISGQAIYSEREKLNKELTSLNAEKIKLTSELNTLKAEYSEVDQFKSKIETRMFAHNEDMMSAHYEFRKELNIIIDTRNKSKSLSKWYDESIYAEHFRLDTPVLL
ncbi:Exonuclease SbcC [Vibrio chagasii]|nr:Exonuclease SbcC [Vibrio chagasii]